MGEIRPIPRMAEILLSVYQGKKKGGDTERGFIGIRFSA
jgi:hypothetical protein